VLTTGSASHDLPAIGSRLHLECTVRAMARTSEVQTRSRRRYAAAILNERRWSDGTVRGKYVRSRIQRGAVASRRRACEEATRLEAKEACPGATPVQLSRRYCPLGRSSSAAGGNEPRLNRLSALSQASGRSSWPRPSKASTESRSGARPHGCDPAPEPVADSSGGGRASPRKPNGAATPPNPGRGYRRRPEGGQR
jgi:hypothetical protein